MKKLILSSVLSVASLAAFGQGTIDVGNLGTKLTFVQPIFLPNPANPTVEQIGSPSTASYPGSYYGGTNGGSTVFGGGVAGSGYDLVFFYTTSASVTSISVANASSLMTVGTQAPLRSSAGNNTANPGGTALTIPTYNPGGLASGVIINWAFGAFNTEGGTITSWAQALANFASGTDPNDQMGVGSVVTGTVLGGTDSGGTFHPEPNTFGGWTSFSLITVTPEPSTIALFGLGAAGLLLFRRRK